MSKFLDLSCPIVSGPSSINAFGLGNATLDRICYGDSADRLLPSTALPPVNVHRISFVTHGNGTHTETISHIGRSKLCLQTNHQTLWYDWISPIEKSIGASGGLKTLVLCMEPMTLDSSMEGFWRDEFITFLKEDDKEYHHITKDLSKLTSYIDYLGDKVISYTQVFQELSKLPNNGKDIEALLICSNIHYLVSREKDNELVLMKYMPKEFRCWQSLDYTASNPPYLTPKLAYALGNSTNLFPQLRHLLVDLPSVDKEKDDGILLAHKLFFNMTDDYVVLDQKIAELEQFLTDSLSHLKECPIQVQLRQKEYADLIQKRTSNNKHGWHERTITELCDFSNIPPDYHGDIPQFATIYLRISSHFGGMCSFESAPSSPYVSAFAVSWMSFKFQWAALNENDDFYKSAMDSLEKSLNHPSAKPPPNICAPFYVKDLYLGSHPPSLQLMEIVEMTLSKFTAMFEVSYHANGYLVITSKVQANPASSTTTSTSSNTTTTTTSTSSTTGFGVSKNSHPPPPTSSKEAGPEISEQEDTTSIFPLPLEPISDVLQSHTSSNVSSPTSTPMTSSGGMLAANRPLIVPIIIRLSDFHIYGVFRLSISYHCFQRSPAFTREKFSGKPSETPSTLSLTPLSAFSTSSKTSMSVTLAWINDPLQSIQVSSSFDGLPKIKLQLQSEIESRIRHFLLVDLPDLVHNFVK